MNGLRLAERVSSEELISKDAAQGGVSRSGWGLHVWGGRGPGKGARGARGRGEERGREQEGGRERERERERRGGGGWIQRGREEEGENESESSDEGSKLLEVRRRRRGIGGGGVTLRGGGGGDAAAADFRRGEQQVPFWPPFPSLFRVCLRRGVRGKNDVLQFVISCICRN